MRLLSNQVNLKTIKIPELNSWRKIGQWVLIIMTVKATCHGSVCSSLIKSLMNNTVEYRYDYHYYTYIQCAWIFYFFFFYHRTIFLLHRKYNCKVGTYMLLLSEIIFQMEIYDCLWLVMGRLFLEVEPTKKLRHVVSKMVAPNKTISWLFARCLEFFFE